MAKTQSFLDVGLMLTEKLEIKFDDVEFSIPLEGLELLHSVKSALYDVALEDEYNGQTFLTSSWFSIYRARRVFPVLRRLVVDNMKLEDRTAKGKFGDIKMGSEVKMLYDKYDDVGSFYHGKLMMSTFLRMVEGDESAIIFEPSMFADMMFGAAGSSFDEIMEVVAVIPLHEELVNAAIKELMMRFLSWHWITCARGASTKREEKELTGHPASKEDAEVGCAHYEYLVSIEVKNETFAKLPFFQIHNASEFDESSKKHGKVFRVGPGLPGMVRHLAEQYAKQLDSALSRACSRFMIVGSIEEALRIGAIRSHCEMKVVILVHDDIAAIRRLKCTAPPFDGTISHLNVQPMSA
jgi:hypothetical protein